MSTPTPEEKVWAAIKSHSVETPATMTIMGFDKGNPAKVLSRGAMTMTTSSDPVGAPAQETGDRFPMRGNRRPLSQSVRSE